MDTRKLSTYSPMSVAEGRRPHRERGRSRPGSRPIKTREGRAFGEKGRGLLEAPGAKLPRLNGSRRREQTDVLHVLLTGTCKPAGSPQNRRPPGGGDWVFSSEIPDWSVLTSQQTLAFDWLGYAVVSGMFQRGPGGNRSRLGPQVCYQNCEYSHPQTHHPG